MRLQKRLKTLNLNQNLDRPVLISLCYRAAGDGSVILGIKVEPLIYAHLFVIDRLDFFFFFPTLCQRLMSQIYCNSEDVVVCYLDILRVSSWQSCHKSPAAACFAWDFEPR